MSVPVPEGDLRQGCPKCQRISIIWRKTLQDWRCGGKGCGITFSKPANIRMLSDEQVTTWRNARRAAKQKWFEDYRSFTDEVVLTQAVLISIEEHERYISCKDTTTFCKKCAYLWDMKKRRYCQECNVANALWHGGRGRLKQSETLKHAKGIALLHYLNL